MRPVTSSTLVLALWALSACTPPPESKPAASPTTTSTVAAPPPPSEPDLSPVAAPKNLVALGRWRNASATLKAVEKIGRLPFPLDTVLLRELGDKELASIIKMDGAIDGAVLIDPDSTPDKPKAMAALSLPLVSMDKAMALATRAGKPVTVRPGVYRLGRAMDLVCDLSVAVGDAPARLICSEHDRDLDALGPWLTRGMPKETLGDGDLHLEVRAEGLRDRFRPELERFGPILPGLAMKALRDEGIREQAVLDLAAGAAGDLPKLANDLDSIAIDLKLDADKTEASAMGTLRFKGATSWVAKLLTHRNDKAGAPPALFWQAPKDSDSVSFNRGSDPKMFDGLREALASSTRSLLGGKVDGADVQALADLMAHLPLSDAQAIVVARGHLPMAKARDIKPEAYKPADAIRDTQEQVRHGLGWTLVGLETKADPYAAWLKDLVKAYNSGTLQGTLKKAVGKRAADRLPTIKSVGSPRGAPAGAVAVEFSLPIEAEDVWYKQGSKHRYRSLPKGDKTRGTVSATVVVVPDGNRTWIGVGADGAALGSHLAMVKDGAAKESTLASRSGLDALKNGSYTGGGFLSVGGLLATFAPSISGSLSEFERKQFDGALAAMPNKGDTPVLLFASGATGASPSNMLEVRLTKGTIDDLVALGHYANSQRMVSEPPPPVEPARPPPPPPQPRPKKKLSHSPHTEVRGMPSASGAGALESPAARDCLRGLRCVRCVRSPAERGFRPRSAAGRRHAPHFSVGRADAKPRAPAGRRPRRRPG